MIRIDIAYKACKILQIFISSPNETIFVKRPQEPSTLFAKVLNFTFT